MSVDATNAEGLNLALPLSEPLVGGKHRRSSFIKNAIAYSGTNLVSQFAQLVSRFIVRAMLAPSAMGIWELALAIQSFVNSFDPGINTAASIELPKLQGANDTDDLSKVRNTVLWSNFLFSIILTIGVFIYLLVSWLRFDNLGRLAVVVAALLVILFSISSSFITIHQGNQSYVSLSKASLYYALLYAVFICLGAYLKGIVGLLFAGVTAYLVQAILLYLYIRKERLKIDRRWDKDTFKRLIKFGLPLRVVEYPQSIFTFLDVFLVTKFLGIEALAIYAIARAFFVQTANIPGMLGNVFVTRIFYLSGARTSRSVLAEEMRDFLLIEYLIFLPLLICFVCLSFSFLTSQFIPAYGKSVPVIRMLIFAVYFVPQTTLIRNFWMLDKKLLALGISNVVGLVGMGASLLITWELRGLSLDSIAFATVIGYFVYFLYIMLTIGTELWGLAGAIKLVTHAVVAVIITKLILNSTPLTIDPKGFIYGAQHAFLSLMWSYALLLPVLIYGAWRAKLPRYLRSRLVRKRAHAE